MSNLFITLTALTGVFFLYYGISCLTSKAMKAEFERFGVPKLRILIGILEIMGGVGLLVGFVIPILGVLAASGIGLLMIIVVIQRIQQGDSLTEMAQAAVFALIAIWLAVFGYIQL